MEVAPLWLSSACAVVLFLQLYDGSAVEAVSSNDSMHSALTVHFLQEMHILVITVNAESVSLLLLLRFFSVPFYFGRKIVQLEKPFSC